MRVSILSSLLALGSLSLAQRPNTTSICDYYTTALLKENTGANQYTLLTLLVNTVVIGNYTKPNVGVAVPGILAKGMQDGVAVNLLPYFDGTLLSSNRGGMSGVSINFLDDGGATPLMMNKPANGTESRQYKLLTHLYQFFGSLLGCSQYGMQGFPEYTGQGSMASVHRFMSLKPAEVNYFITQVGLAAASFGVAKDDITAVGMALNKLFGYRCSPPTTAIKAQGPQLQSICVDESCPLDPMATCAAYPASASRASVAPSGTMMPNGTMPTGMSNATTTGMMGGTTMMTGATMMPSSTRFTGAAAVATQFAGAVVGVALGAAALL